MDDRTLLEAIESVEIVNICELLELIYPGYWDDMQFLNYDYDTTTEAIREWCEANDAHYYANIRERFSLAQAAVEAHKLGKSKVVVEDLS